MSLFDGKFTQEDDENEHLKSLSVGYVTNSGLSAVFDLGVNLDDGTLLYVIPQDQSKKIAELEAENKQAKEAIEILNAGKPLGEIVGLHTAQNAIAEALKLKDKIAELESKLLQKPDEIASGIEILHCHKKIAELEADKQRLIESLEDADELIAIEPYEHVNQEAAEAHENIRTLLAEMKEG
jgi:hypothetical protein